MKRDERGEAKGAGKSNELEGGIAPPKLSAVLRWRER
jgi:hypothetical protein